MAHEPKPRRRSKTRKDVRAATEPEQPSAPAAPPPPSEPPAIPIVADNLDEAFVKALEADFLRHGAVAIAAMRAEKPTDYMKIIASLRAKQTSDTADPLREMSDAELDRSIEELARRVGYEIRFVAAPRREGPPGHDSADAD
jgi:hypothetical protein